MLKGNQDTNVIETIDKFSSQNIGKNFIDTKTTAVSTTTNPQLLLQQLSSKFFNEMQDEHVLSSQAGQRLEEWLSQHTLDELNALNQVAKGTFFTSRYYLYRLWRCRRCRAHYSLRYHSTSHRPEAVEYGGLGLGTTGTGAKFILT